MRFQFKKTIDNRVYFFTVSDVQTLEGITNKLGRGLYAIFWDCERVKCIEVENSTFKGSGKIQAIQYLHFNR